MSVFAGKIPTPYSTLLQLTVLAFLFREYDSISLRVCVVTGCTSALFAACLIHFIFGWKGFKMDLESNFFIRGHHFGEPWLACDKPSLPAGSDQLFFPFHNKLILAPLHLSMISKILYRLLQPFIKVYLRRPVKELFCLCNIRAPFPWVVFGQFFIRNCGF